MVEGNSLLRGRAADEAVEELTSRLHQRSIYNVAFGRAGQRIFTMTAPDENIGHLFQAAEEEFANLLAEDRDPADSEALRQYGNASVLLSAEVLNKRGSDAVNRITKRSCSPAPLGSPCHSRTG